jgi:hypothetical protein
LAFTGRYKQAKPATQKRAKFSSTAAEAAASNKVQVRPTTAVLRLQPAGVVAGAAALIDTTQGAHQNDTRTPISMLYLSNSKFRAAGGAAGNGAYSCFTTMMHALPSHCRTQVHQHPLHSAKGLSIPCNSAGHCLRNQVKRHHCQAMPEDCTCHNCYNNCYDKPCPASVQHCAAMPSKTSTLACQRLF